MVKIQNTLASPPSTVFFFSKPGCTFCEKLESELRLLEIPHCIIDTPHDDYQELFNATGQRTFPQLFINKRFIGGYSDFAKLQMTGSLAPLLEPLGIIVKDDF
jgi:glutaredoxin